MRKIGINLQSAPDIGMSAYIQKIKALGFDSVFTGVWAPEKMQETAKLTEKAGLVFDSLHAPFSHINDMWYAGYDGDCMLQEMTHTVDVCCEVGAPVAVVHLSSGEKAPAPTDIGRGRFIKLVEYGASRNVKIAFENQRKLANLAWAMEEFQDSDSAGFCWDCGHEACFTSGREYMPLFGDRLLCTHLHDNNKIYNDDMHIIPFDGKIDFNRVAELIRESGYQGTLMLEVLPNYTNFYGDMSCEEYLERSAAAIKRLRDMVDGTTV